MNNRNRYPTIAGSESQQTPFGVRTLKASLGSENRIYPVPGTNYALDRFDPEKIKTEFSVFDNIESKFHYLDSAATSQVPDCVVETMVNQLQTHRANVKRGIYKMAVDASESYERARQRVAAYLGAADESEVIFTSGTTSGINMLAYSLIEGFAPGDEILVSQLEHHSNIVPWQIVGQKNGIRIKYLPVMDDGRLNLNRLEEFITEKTRLLAITHGSNVTGAITNVPYLAEVAHYYGCKLMLDGAQMAAQGPLDLLELDADYYVFSGHKVYGPTGIGVLWAKKSLLETLPPAFGGGEMITHVNLEGSEYAPPPHRFEAGTPPITQAIGLAQALDWLCIQDLDGLHQHLIHLTEKIITGLKHLNDRQHAVKVIGPVSGHPRLPLVAFTIEGIHPHDICQILNDRHGVATRGGNHCAQPLHDSLGLEGSVRVSLAAFNSEQDVDALLNGVEDCMAKLG